MSDDQDLVFRSSDIQTNTLVMHMTSNQSTMAVNSVSTNNSNWKISPYLLTIYHCSGTTGVALSHLATAFIQPLVHLRYTRLRSTLVLRCWYAAVRSALTCTPNPQCQIGQSFWNLRASLPK